MRCPSKPFPGAGQEGLTGTGTTHTFTELTTGCGRDGRWLWFLKPRAVLETEAAHSSIRYPSSALDLLFTKKNPSLPKWPRLLQPSISTASNNLVGGKHKTQQLVFILTSRASQILLGRRKMENNQNTECQLRTNKREVCAAHLIVTLQQATWGFAIVVWEKFLSEKKGRDLPQGCEGNVFETYIWYEIL